MTHPGTAAIAALLRVDSTSEAAPGRFAQSLLETLAAVTGAVAGKVLADQDDGRGLVMVAATGPDSRLDDCDLRFPFASGRGEIVLAVAGTEWAQVIGSLAADRLGSALDNERLREANLRRQAWLTFLAECSDLLAQSLDVTLTLALIPRLVVPRLGEWCALYLADDSGAMTLHGAAHADETRLPDLLSCLDSAGSGPAASRWQFTVPLTARGQFLGSLTIGWYAGQRRDPDEPAIAEDVARRAALALDNARTHQERRRVAQTLQAALLPPTLPTIAGLGLAAEYVPATDGVDVGGDFYDVIALPDGRCLLLVGDVSGKGVQAATVTGLVRDVVRVLVRDGRPIPSILSTLNETLFERREHHCTMALAAVGPGTDQRAVTLYLAGHDRPVLATADGKASPVGAWGTALGLLPEVTFPEATVTLGPGDTMVFYTDGVIDRRRGEEFFGLERLKRATGDLAGYPAEVIAARLRAIALDFSDDPPRDDMAILVLRNEVV